jgi:diguanylate cyclase (GGDEF)-like protein/PAS domain S-box-containing protein
LIQNTAETMNVAGSATRQLDDLTSLFEHNPLPAFIARMDDGKILCFNQAFSALTGYQPGDAGLVSIADVFRGDEAIDAMIDLLIRNEQCWIPEIAGIKRDGMLVPVSVSANRIRIGGSAFLLAIMQEHADHPAGTHPDKTGLNTPDALPGLQIIQNERRYRTLYDDSPSMFFTLDHTGRISSVNRFGAGHLGCSVDSMLDKLIVDFVHKDDRESFLQELQKCTETRNKIHRIEFRLIHQFGEALWVRAAIRPIVYEGDRMLLVTCEDISEARILSEQLEYQAMHDSLTGLINRSEFERRLRRVLMLTTENAEHALCYLDLDQFKVINDTCGHLAGDELLRRLGDLLNTVVRKRDTLARLGGDEFAVLLEHCPFSKAMELAENLLNTIKTFRFEWQDKHFTLGASIGLVPISRDSGTLSDILSSADSACYAAKDAGRNRVHIYNIEDSELSMRRNEMHWVAEITNALEQNRFLLALQPIVNLQPGKGQNEGRHYEILLRMQDKGGQLIMPGTFLPAAEKYNLSGKLDQWVVDQVFSWLLNDPAEMEVLHICSINLSGHSISNPHFMNYLVNKLLAQPELARKICFEITETAAIVNLGHAIKFMSTMKDLGCSFSLDDFGTGLSSFSYLKNLPVDFLKIDGSFIRNIVQDPIDQSMVLSINQIGQVMGKATIAEFVENEEIRDILAKIGVNYAQGYGIGRPVLLRDIKRGISGQI